MADDEDQKQVWLCCWHWIQSVLLHHGKAFITHTMPPPSSCLLLLSFVQEYVWESLEVKEGADAAETGKYVKSAGP